MILQMMHLPKRATQAVQPPKTIFCCNSYRQVSPQCQERPHHIASKLRTKSLLEKGLEREIIVIRVLSGQERKLKKLAKMF